MPLRIPFRSSSRPRVQEQVAGVWTPAVSTSPRPSTTCNTSSRPRQEILPRRSSLPQPYIGMAKLALLCSLLLLCCYMGDGQQQPQCPCHQPEPAADVVSGDDQQLPVITMGFLSSFHEDGVGKLIAGAVPLAVQRINNRSDILPGYLLNFTAGDSGMPGTPQAIRRMSEMREEGAVSFIGPDHGCANEAMVSAAWNIPMITYKCSDLKVSDKNVYSTFARTLPPSSKISKSVIALLKFYSWTKITLVVADNPADKQVEEALILLAKDHQINITAHWVLPGNYISKDNQTVLNIIEKTYAKTRVYVLLADTLVLADLVRMMDAKGLLAKGEYVVVYVEEEELYNSGKHLQYIRPVTQESNKDSDFVVDPFRSVLILTPSAVINEAYLQFRNDVLWHSSLPPFNIPFHPIIDVELPIYAALAYDAVMLYAHALTRALNESQDVRDGESILNFIRSRPYHSILGYSVMVDENGDAEGNYTMLSLIQETPDSTRSMRPVGHFTYNEGEPLPQLHLNRTVDWITGHPPTSEPRCGFNDEHCQYKPDWRLLFIVITCACVLAVAARFAFRHYRYEHKLACLLWKVDIKDIIMVNNNSEYTLQNIKNTINMHGLEAGRFSILSELSGSGKSEEPVPGRCLASIGFYRGNVVFFKPVFKRSVDLSRSIRKEMIQMREMRHENVNPFIGACVDPSSIGVLTNFAARGSLEDVLMNEDMDLDTMFVASLVYDLIKGMIYLHDSEVVSHGSLKTSNCLVDSRWVLQISDFGLHEFRAGQELPPCVEPRKRRGLLWRAPELLRMTQPPPRGTQKGDVYSFAIILYEITGRAGPWGPGAPSLDCVLERVMYPKEGAPCGFRPSLDAIDAPEYVISCIEQCWNEDPECRPDFRFINVMLRQMQAGLKANIFDNMIAMMEKYAYNLEGLVQERTNQLVEEKKKTENLLLRMLPKSVAEQLKKGQPVQAESFDLVTIYFSDIVGFTVLSAVSTPLQVVDLLNDLYICFDSIIGNYDVYKVETIGDAYMVVSGLPICNGDQHAGQVASMALHLLQAIQSFEIRHRPGERLRLRIGIHSGPCVAGVVGLKMPRYCLFGDTVNTASRMESTGEALKIHVSEQCKEILEKLGGYVVQERGLTPVKGKGEMRTYWLLGHDDPRVSLSGAGLAPQGTLALSPKVSEDQQCHLLVPGMGFQRSGVVSPSQSRDSLLPGEVGLDCQLLLGGGDSRQPDERARLLADHNYNSCLSLFQECKRALLRELRRDSAGRLGHRSAPTIAFGDRAEPPHDCLL